MELQESIVSDYSLVYCSKLNTPGHKIDGPSCLHFYIITIITDWDHTFPHAK